MKLHLLSATLTAVVGAACIELTWPGPPAPPCLEAAPLMGRFDSRAPGYIVVYHDGVNAVGATARIAELYGLNPMYLYTTLPGFAATIDDDVVADLRCEPQVHYISHDRLIELDQ